MTLTQEQKNAYTLWREASDKLYLLLQPTVSELDSILTDARDIGIEDMLTTRDNEMRAGFVASGVYLRRLWEEE